MTAGALIAALVAAHLALCDPAVEGMDCRTWDYGVTEWTGDDALYEE